MSCRVVGSVSTYTVIFCMAERRSSSETMLYRSKILRVRWPEISIATRSGTPARTIFLTPVRRRSWKSFSGTLCSIPTSVSDHVEEAGLDARRGPRLAEVSNRLASPVEHPSLFGLTVFGSVLLNIVVVAAAAGPDTITRIGRS